jgi:hypothetical protein
MWDGALLGRLCYLGSSLVFIQSLSSCSGAGSTGMKKTSLSARVISLPKKRARAAAGGCVRAC